jgi:hypothetical protein
VDVTKLELQNLFILLGIICIVQNTLLKILEVKKILSGYDLYQSLSVLNYPKALTSYYIELP